MLEMWDVTPVTHAQWKVEQYSVWAESAKFFFCEAWFYVTSISFWELFQFLLHRKLVENWIFCKSPLFKLFVGPFGGPTMKCVGYQPASEPWELEIETCTPSTAQYRQIQPCTAQYNRVPPTTDQYRQVQSSTVQYSLVQPTTAQ